MKKKVIDLEILEDFLDSGVSKISLVDSPAIEVDWMAFKEEQFVYPNPGEDKDGFLGRCVAVNIDEGRPRDQAVAICYRVWDEHKMSIDPSGLAPYVDEITEDKKKKENMEGTEMYISGYNTKYFYICPGAQETFKTWLGILAEEDTIGMIRSAAQIADNVFKIEKDVLEAEVTTPEQMKEALVLIDDFKDLAHEIDEELGTVSDVSYMDGHAEVIAKYYGQEDFAAVEDLKVGDPVSWKTADQNPRGRIREIIRQGGKTVPGTSFVLEGSPEDPGYIIEIYEKVEGKWKPTGKYAGRKAGSILKNVELWRAERQIFADEDQRILIGPVAIPDLEIIRKDENGDPYYVKFTREVVQKMSEKFMRELRNHDMNIEHEEIEAGTYVMESWIVEDPEHDKINAKYGFNLPEGTWVAKMRVNDENVWKAVKAGKLNGFSIEGNFMSKEDYEDYMKDRKTYERIKNILKTIS
jgi:hypothetical protein